MSAAVTVYSKPRCVQCEATKRALTKAGINYDEVDLTTNPDLIAWITDELGYAQAPVVVVDDDNHWCGFRPDKIAGIPR